MSTFTFGGSGLQLDIAGTAHQALSRGDVVGINPLVAGAGVTTISVGDLDDRVQQATIYGVVLGSNGKSAFDTGEDVLLRIIGVCDAAFSAATTAGHAAQINPSANNLDDVAVGSFTANAAGVRTVGVVHETLAAAGVGSCWFNGLTSWG